VQFMPIVDAVDLIQMEYAELPELRLTFWQAQRLWNLSEELCERALAALMASGFLARTPDGSYVRRSSSPTSIERIAPRVCQSPGAIT
jgi:hypothetical protein